MQIVIDIPNWLYNAIMECKEPHYSRSLGDAVRDGVPLLKGHGKLIAEPTEEDIAKTVGGQNDFVVCIKDAVKAVFDNAPTIIEADKEIENVEK